MVNGDAMITHLVLYIYLAMPLRPKIERRLDALDRKTLELFQYLNRVPPELLTQKPKPGYWNALEALNHIYLGEKASMQYVCHKLTKSETIPVKGPDAWFRSLLLKWVLYSPLKFKSPPHIDMSNNQTVLGLGQLKQGWKDLRQELRKLLAGHEEGLTHKLTYKHPYAGRITLLQMLIFFEDHLTHHTRQIRRILGQVTT